MEKKLIIKKNFGEIEATYKMVGDTPVLLKAEANNVLLFEGERKFSYVLKDDIEYIGFQLFDKEYETFCNIFRRKAMDTKAFISLDPKNYKIIKQEIKFGKELEEARESGKVVEKKIGMVPCNDKNEECNWDYLIYEIYPDGRIVEKRQHTW